MALFESYERREKQILAVINQYGINTIEECADVCKAKGLDIYKLVDSDSAAYCVSPLSVLKADRLNALNELLTLLLLSARDFRLSVSLAL